MSWAITFLIFALIAAGLGLSGLAGTATWLAQLLFGLFLILCTVTYLFGRRPPAG